MAILLDEATKSGYDALTLASDRAAYVVASLTGTVAVEVYDGANVLRASGTMQLPWATASASTITVAEVTGSGINVTSGGTPDSLWYCQFRSGTRFVRGTFGVSTSSEDFKWSLASFQTGSRGSLGTVVLTATGTTVQPNRAPTWTTLPSISIEQGQSISLAGYASDLDGDALTITIDGSSPMTDFALLARGLTIGSNGMLTASITATVGAAGSVILRADDGQDVVTPPSNTSVPIISGTPRVGVTLTASTGAWSGTPPLTPAYQWVRGSTNISGATSATYVPVTADITANLSVRVTMTNSAGSAAATSAQVGPVLPADTSSFSTQLTLTSVVGGTNLPWAFGHAFKQGDIPSGSTIASTIGEFQSTATTYWSDGSVKHAIIAGRTTLSAATATPITIGIGAPTSGATLTTTDLASALPTTTITVGSHTLTLGSIVASPHRVVCTGPVMSNWIYRQAVAGSSHLVIWCDVRLYKGGQVEILPWVENAYLLVPSPTALTATCAVSIGGSTVFPSTSITLYHHTRVLLVSGRTDGYWSGTDPQITPKHDLAYLRATKLVPNYGWTSPSATKLNALTQSYTPNTYAGVSLMTSSGGDSSAILGFTASAPDVMYVTTGDIRAYKGALTMSFAGGTWDVHYRDETTNEPFRFATYPRVSLNVQDTPIVPAGSGGDSNWGATGSRTSHQMSRGFLAWIISGRWWHLEEAHFWVGINYLVQTTASRLNANGVIRSTAGANTDRGAAWGLRQLAQTLAITPTTHPCYADLLASWEANTSAYHSDITGTWANNLGIFPHYGPIYGWVQGYHGAQYEDIAGWMQNMLALVWGYTSDLGLPQSAASLARHLAIRSHGYKLPVGLSGDGSSGNWNYRWFGPYELVVANAPSGPWMTNWGEALAVHINNNVSGVVPVPTDNRLYRPSTTTAWPSTDPTYMSSFFGQHYAALAYAAEHGAPGAAEAWARVRGTTNHDAITTQFNDLPQYGIVPRV